MNTCFDVLLKNIKDHEFIVYYNLNNMENRSYYHEYYVLWLEIRSKICDNDSKRIECITNNVYRLHEYFFYSMYLFNDHCL